MLLKSINWLTYDVLKLNSEQLLGQTVNFFIYDSVKIILLLFSMISVIGFIRSFVSQSKIKSWLSGKHPLIGNFVAAMFGALTPFCSCSSIPLFLSFLKTGVPLGTTFSFLVTSPIVNEYLVVLMIGLFGFKITAVYVVSGILIGTIAGSIIGKLNLEDNIEQDFTAIKDSVATEQTFTNISARIRFGVNEAITIVKDLWKWILFGVALGAIIHNYVPQEFIQQIVARGGIFSVPLATILGVPMYGSCAAIVPIAVVLFGKGVPLGTALSFMMAISALSLPEAIILRKAMNLKLIGIFFGIVTIGIIFIGYMINILQPLLM